MGEGIQRLGAMEELFGPDRLTEALRGKVREMIMTLAEAELAEVLAAGSYERREGRRGYRNGKRQRSISTGLGATVIELPRARIIEGERDKEWQSGLIARYQRRARSVDQALLGCYLSGANGRRIRGALSPLLRGAPLSKSAISRLVGRLEALFTQWRSRSLASEAVVFLYLDAIALRVRIAKKVISVPVLVGLGVKEDGQKVILDLELFQSESSSCWEGFFEGLISRGLKPPCLVIMDGNKGLRARGGKELARHSGATLHRAQATQPGAPRTASRFGGSQKRLSSDRLCRVVRAGQESVPGFYLEVEEACAQGGGEFGGSGRGVVDLLPFSEKPVEIASHHQCHRAAQWGVSPPGEDPEFSARCARSRAFAVRLDHQWSDPDPAHRWMAGP